MGAPALCRGEQPVANSVPNTQPALPHRRKLQSHHHFAALNEFESKAVSARVPVRSTLYQDVVVNRRFSIPSCLILDSSVEAGTPSLAAAPCDPATFPRLFAKAASIISFS